jgi:hypothetical protein
MEVRRVVGFADRAFNQRENGRYKVFHGVFERAVGRADHPTKT